MDTELKAEHQRINAMSFKDLTSRAAAAMKRKPAEAAKTSADAKEPKNNDKEGAPKSKKS